MALDEADHRLFIGVHVPPRLAVFDTNSGRMAAAVSNPQDSDDLYFDADRKRSTFREARVTFRCIK